MKAAVVTDFARPPSYQDCATPAPLEGEVRVAVSAAALTPLVRGQASGKHYSSPTSLPFVPGSDGVGRLDDGRRVYFAFPRSPHGTMAEYSVVRREHCVDIPSDVDDVTAAAIANPGMSSWAALTVRGEFKAGEAVLIHGATGSSGRLAIRIAKHLGASRIVVTGRTRPSVEALAALGATRCIALDQPSEVLVREFGREIYEAGVDVILDYLWGAPAEALLRAFVGHREGVTEPRVRYVQIGSLAGGDATLPASALRSSGLELRGSGIGSVPLPRLLVCVKGVLESARKAGLELSAKPVSLADVGVAWQHESAARVVFTT
jgi:NADPH:quinone reductase-like Zn-dependent oxidoreductase